VGESRGGERGDVSYSAKLQSLVSEGVVLAVLADTVYYYSSSTSRHSILLPSSTSRHSILLQ
jgi:hypothetical protein